MIRLSFATLLLWMGASITEDAAAGTPVFAVPAWLSSADVIVVAKASEGNCAGAEFYVTEIWKADRPFEIAELGKTLNTAGTSVPVHAALFLVRFSESGLGKDSMQTPYVRKLPITPDGAVVIEGAKFDVNNMRVALQLARLAPK